MKKFFSKLSKKINIKKEHRHHFVLGFFAFLSLFVVVFFNSNEQAISSQSQNLSGYAWSSNDNGGVGWISFNCTDGGLNGDSVCGSTEYGVNIDSTTGNIVGYAWSGSGQDLNGDPLGYGWLKFGGLNTADMPTGGGTTQVNARKVGNNIEGWARFCSAALNADCTGNRDSESSYTGGWDGWVSLRGTGYGVSTTGGDYLTGYAWGGDDYNKNIGWIDFSKVKYNQTQATLEFTSNDSDNTVANDTPVTLSWDGVGLVDSTTGCSATMVSGSAPSDWVGSKNSPNGSFVFTPALNGIYTFGLECNAVLGGTVSQNLTIYVGGAGVTINATPFMSSTTTTLTWSPSGGNGVLNNCVASNGWSGSKASSGSESVNVPDNPTTFTISCVNSLGVSVSASVVVPHLNPLVPVLSLRHTGVRQKLPLGSGFITDMVWTSQNVISGSCVKSVIPPNPSVNWSGTIPAIQTPSGRQNAVVVPETAPANTTYRITCDLEEDQATDLCVEDGETRFDKICVNLAINENSTASSSIKLPVFREN